MLVNILLLLLLSAYSTGVSSQQVKDALKPMNAFITSNSQYEIAITAKVYTLEKTKKPDIELKALTAKNNNAYYVQHNEDELFSNGELAIAIDNEKKQMSISKKSSIKADLTDPLQSLTQLDSINAFVTQVSFQSQDGQDIYTLAYKEDFIFRSIVIYINQNTHLLSKLDYYYNEKYFDTYNKVEIVYDIKEHISESLSAKFNTSYYCQKKGNTWIPSLKYQNYIIAN